VRRANRNATRATITALQAGGRLEGIDTALVGLARVTADMLDEAMADDEKSYALAALGRLHLQTVLALTGKDSGTGDAGLAEIIAALSTPLGYPTDQPA
jgi:hypothetical protein